MTQALSRNPSLVLKRSLDLHHLSLINLGQSVLVPYQLSASSCATEAGYVDLENHFRFNCPNYILYDPRSDGAAALLDLVFQHNYHCFCSLQDL